MPADAYQMRYASKDICGCASGRKEAGKIRRRGREVGDGGEWRGDGLEVEEGQLGGRCSGGMVGVSRT